MALGEDAFAIYKLHYYRAPGLCIDPERSTLPLDRACHQHSLACGFHTGERVGAQVRETEEAVTPVGVLAVIAAII